MNLVVDSSVLLMAYFPDEKGHEKAQSLVRDYAKGSITFHAPSLITYEIINACLVASRMSRFTEEMAKELMDEMLGIEMILEDVERLKDRIFSISVNYQRSAYDSAYVAVAESGKIPFLTADRKLFNSLKRDFAFVESIDNYQLT